MSRSPKHLEKSTTVCKHVDIYTFKTKPCKIRESHLPKRCPFYHDARKDRRRPLSYNYGADMCVYALNEKECPYGETCPNAHNRVEEFYHPTKYKTKFCTTYPHAVASCEYGECCCFAHSEADIKIDLLHKFERDADFYMFHFKTVWCPFNETNHARDQCVYAHNWQDYRRRPHVYSYEKNQCSNWNLSKIINVYFDGCPNGHSCRYSHGWKEQEYHPLAYKTNHCRHGEGCTKLHCPFYHNEKDKRNPIPSIFVYAPRTRVFTFMRRAEQMQNVTQTMYTMQPAQPPMFVGSPMEGLRYSPVGSPSMSPSSLILDRNSPPLSYSPPLGSPSALNPFAPQFRQHSYPDNVLPPSPPPGLEIVDELARRSKHQTDSISLVTESFTKEPIPIPVFQPSPKSSLNIPRHDSIRKPSLPKKVESPGKDYLSDLPVLSKDTLQFLRSGADDDNIEEIVLDPFKKLLKKNNVEHLHEKFSTFGINEHNITILTDVSLEQLGITGEDKHKILSIIESVKAESPKANS